MTNGFYSAPDEIKGSSVDGPRGARNLLSWQRGGRVHSCVRPHMRASLSTDQDAEACCPRRNSRLAGSPANLTSGGMTIPTTVPHSGPESSRRVAPLCEDGGQAPCRTTVTPPWTTEPGRLGSPDSACSADQDAGFMAAPSGTTPWLTNRHSAISNFRASATTITFRMRVPITPARSRYQRT